MGKKEVLARSLRILTVPPVMALFLITILAGNRSDIFTAWSESTVLVLLLVVVPALAYPWQRWTSADGRANREKQRSMAFAFTIVGYFVAFIWAIITRRNRYLVMISMTYFLSVLMLSICNKSLHIRASGHMCGVVAPILLLTWLIDWKALPLCLLLLGAVVWSSLYLKRHTIRELVAGCMICIVSVVFSAGTTMNMGWRIS